MDRIRQRRSEIEKQRAWDRLMADIDAAVDPVVMDRMLNSGFSYNDAREYAREVAVWEGRP